MIKKIKKYGWIILLIVILVFIDQLIKILIKQNPIGQDMNFIGNILKLTYTTNSGFAFSIGNNTSSIIITDIIVIFIIARFLVVQRDKTNIATKISLSLILSGGIGNLLDRIFRKEVIDYINIRELIPNFPIFNLADVFIVVGFVMFAAITAFNTFDLIKRKKNIN